MLPALALRRPLLCLACCLVLAATAIAQGTAGGQTAAAKQAANSAGDDVSGLEEYERFARTLEAAVQRGDTDALRPMFDFDALFERAWRGVEEPTDAREEFFQGVRVGMDGPNGLIQGLLGRLADGGSVHFLRVRKIDGEVRALFRMLGRDEAGLDYQDFVIAKSPRGLRVVDVYAMLTGELLSQTLRRYWIQVAASASRSLLQRLLPSEGAFLEHAEEFQRMAKLAKNDGPRALALYRSMPESMQRDRVVLVMYLGAASQVSDQAYFEALARWRELFPADATADLHSIDAFYLKQEFPPLFAALDRIDRAIGGDPYLELLRANALWSSHDAAGARNACLRAIDTEPDLRGPWWMLVTISLEEQRFDETLKLLKQVHVRFRPEWTDLSTVPAYAGFVAAPQHAEWLAYLEGH